MKVVILSFTQAGTRLGERIGSQFRNEGITCQNYAPAGYAFADILPFPDNPKELIREGWGETSFLFIGAVGIAVRYIAPYVKDKFTDSAVVVMDEKAGYVIPLLSGHLGGAVELSNQLAVWTGAVPVQTTATDVRGKFAVDVFAKKNHLYLTEREAAKQISAAVLDGKQVGLWIGEGLVFKQEDFQKSCLKELILCGSKEELYSFAEEHPVIVITKTAEEGRQFVESLAGSLWGDVRNNVCGCESKHCILLLYPINITAGVGCRKQISKELFEKGLNDVLEGYGLEPTQLKQLASIDLKKEESAILVYAQKYKVPFLTYPAEQLQKITEVSATSRFVKQVTGIDNVCERAAQTADGDGELLCPKCIREQMTVALTETEVILQF